MKRKFGIRMDGCEEGFEQILKETVQKFLLPTTILEIGTAGGTTLRAMWDILSEMPNCCFTLVGSDLPQGWSLDKPSLNRLFGDKLNIISEDYITQHRNGIVQVQPNLVLMDAKKLIAQYFEFWETEINFCFIDGCHGAPCVKADFLAVSKCVPAGGVVVFHDAGEIEQGSDWQGHCNQNINVRQALKDLGLLDNSRPGWRFIKEIQGDRIRGGEGNNCVVVEKV